LGTLLSSIPDWLVWALLLVFTLGVVSVFHNARSTLHALNSLSDVALYSTLVLAILVVAACRQVAGPWFDRTAIGLLSLTGLVVGVQELLGVLVSYSMGTEFNYRMSLLYFSHPRFYNQVQTWLIPMYVALPLIFSRQKLAVLVCLTILGLQWYIILMTGARGSFVSISTAILLAMILFPWLRRRMMLTQLAGLTLGALLFVGVLYSFNSGMLDPTSTEGSGQSRSFLDLITGAKDINYDSTGNPGSYLEQSIGRPMLSSSGRTEQWMDAVQNVVASPLLGIGPMNIACTEPSTFGHPHNFALQLASEWGLPATMILSGIFLFLLWRLIRALRMDCFEDQSKKVLASLLLTGLLAATVHSCLSGVMVMPASQVTAVLIGGMLLGLCPLEVQSTVRPNSYKFLVAGICLSTFLLAVGSYELATMKQREMKRPPMEMLAPRIWQDSKLCRFYTDANSVTY
jgi:O-antigen ligase